MLRVLYHCSILGAEREERRGPGPDSQSGWFESEQSSGRNTPGARSREETERREESVLRRRNLPFSPPLLSAFSLQRFASL